MTQSKKVERACVDMVDTLMYTYYTGTSEEMLMPAEAWGHT